MTPPLLAGLPGGKYRVALADVPWRFVVRNRATGLGRSPDRHYSTMTLEEIAALPVARVMRGDSRLFFCVTGPFLAVGAHIPIMRAWGFEPSAMAFVWLKIVRSAAGVPVLISDDVFKMGPGLTTRQNAEYVILGRRGAPPERLSRSVRQVIASPAREHSRKPEELHRRIEAYARGPYLELFGRRQRSGWTVRGDQAEMFDGR